MRRWIRLAAALYPRGWRDRYGEEFQALLEDATPGWREFTDVMWGALQMQMSTASTYLKIAGATAVLSAVLAVAASFGVPRQYVSEAVVQMTPKPAAQAARSAPPKEALDNAAVNQFHQLATEILSRNSLVEIIQKPSLDLYKQERQRMPIEEVILRMRQDIRISPVPTPPSSGGPLLTAWISFAYGDREKAQEVVRRLTAGFAELNATIERSREALWHIAWPPSDSVPPGEEVVVLDPASLPKPLSPNRLEFLAWGLGGGTAFGAVRRNGNATAKMDLADGRLRSCRLCAGRCRIVPRTEPVHLHGRLALRSINRSPTCFQPNVRHTGNREVPATAAGSPQPREPVTDHSKALARPV
jgi:hypothetical protein